MVNKHFSLAEKKEAIEKIEALDLNQTNIGEIERLLNNIFTGYYLGIPIVDRSWILYRGVKYLKKPKLYSELIYPPKDKAKINRASKAGEQMFYCSTSKKAVLYELAAKPGDTLVISTWTSSQNLLLSHVGYTESNLKNMGAIDSSPIVIKGFEKYDGEENRFISDYLSKTFSQPIADPDVYKLTIAIAKYFLSSIDGNVLLRNTNFDGLLYPTIRFQANSDNICLKPSSLDQGKISLEKVEFIEIVRYSDNKYRYTIKDIAESFNSDLLFWKELQYAWTVNDEDNDLYFIDGNAYNEGGEVIPHD